MERTTQTLHFRWHPRLMAGQEVTNRELITSAEKIILKGRWLCQSIAFNGPFDNRPNAYTAVLEPLPEKP
jgi:hypothetical protein